MPQKYLGKRIGEYGRRPPLSRVRMLFRGAHATEISATAFVAILLELSGTGSSEGRLLGPRFICSSDHVSPSNLSIVKALLGTHR